MWLELVKFSLKRYQKKIAEYLAARVQIDILVIIKNSYTFTLEIDGRAWPASLQHGSNSTVQS